MQELNINVSAVRKHVMTPIAGVVDRKNIKTLLAESVAVRKLVLQPNQGVAVEKTIETKREVMWGSFIPKTNMTEANCYLNVRIPQNVEKKHQNQKQFSW
jgi:hypothetical protein